MAKSATPGAHSSTDKCAKAKSAAPGAHSNKKVIRKCAKGQKTTRGPASSLPGASFKEWVAHCKSVAPVWLHILCQVQHCLGCRVTECRTLKGSDVNFKKGHVVVNGLKGHGVVQKPLVPHARQVLSALKKNGHTTQRTVKQGSRADITIEETWSWPAPGGYLFPKVGASDQRMTKDTVAKAIVRARKSFKSSRADVNPNGIRAHSNRHRWINDAKMSNIPKQAAMAYSLISSESTYDKVYGKPTMEQAGYVIGKSGMQKKMPRLR